MNPTQIKYGLITLALGCALMGAAYGGYHLRDLSAIAESAAKDKALSDARDEFNAKVSKLENDQIVATIELQAKHNERIKSLEADNANSERRLTGLVRQARALAGRCQVSGETPDPGSPEGSSPGSDDRLSERVGADFNRVGFNANKLAAIVKACQEWSARVGR